MAEHHNSELGRPRFPLAGTQLCPRPVPPSRRITDTSNSSSSVNSSAVYYSSSGSDEDKEDALSMTSTSSCRDDEEEGEVQAATGKIWTLAEQAQEAQEEILRGQVEQGDVIQRIGRDMAKRARQALEQGQQEKGDATQCIGRDTAQGVRQALEQEQQEKDLTDSNLKMCLGVLVQRLETSEGEKENLQRKNRHLQAEVTRLSIWLAATSTTTVGVCAPAESPVAEATTGATVDVTATMVTPSRDSVGPATSSTKSPSPLAGVIFVETKSALATVSDKGYSPETAATFAKSKSLLTATLAEMNSARHATVEKGYSPGTVACFAKTKSLLTDTFAKMKSTKVAPLDKACEYSPDTKASFARSKFLLTDTFEKMKSAKAVTGTKSMPPVGAIVKHLSPVATTGITTGTEGTSPTVVDSSNMTPVTTTVTTGSKNTSSVGPVAKAKSPAATTDTTGTESKSPVGTSSTKIKSPAAITGITVSKRTSPVTNTGSKNTSLTTTNGSKNTSPTCTIGTKTDLFTANTSSNGKAVSPAASVMTPLFTRRPLGNINPNSGKVRAAGAQTPSLSSRPVVNKPAVNHGSIDRNVPSIAPGVVTGTVKRRAFVCREPVRVGTSTSRVVTVHDSGDGGKVGGAAPSGKVVRSAEAHDARGKAEGAAPSGRVLRSDTRAAAAVAAAMEKNDAGLSAVSGGVPAGVAAPAVPAGLTRTTTRRPNQRTSISTTGRGAQNRGKFMRF